MPCEQVERINRSVRESFAAFISHAKADAALEARFLKEELQARLDGRHGRNVFLDSDHLRNLRSLEQHVRGLDLDMPCTQPYACSRVALLKYAVTLRALARGLTQVQALYSIVISAMNTAGTLSSN